MDNVTPKLCGICDVEQAKYVCPRCGLPYCSLVCYKDEQRHLSCSESFYKDCVVTQLKSQELQDPEGAKKMADVLQRFKKELEDEPEEDFEDNEETLDSDDDEPLDKRLAGIDLNDADGVWDSLTPGEREEFKKLVTDVSSTSTIIPEWVPWWRLPPEKVKLVEEIEKNPLSPVKVFGEIETNEESVVKKAHREQPDILSPIPPMSSLTKVKPNDHVKIGLANVIASYVWTSRLYNGEILTYEFPEEVAGTLISLSSFLGKDSIFSSAQQALADVSMNACNNPDLFDGGPTIVKELSDDVLLILSGPSNRLKPALGVVPDLYMKKTYVLSALSQIFSLLSIALKSSKNKTDPPPQSSTSTSLTFTQTFKKPTAILVERKLLLKAKRKIHYLIAFANQYATI